MSPKRQMKKGQGLVEYALILALVGVVAIGVLALTGPAVGNILSNVHAVLEGGAAALPPAASPTPGTNPNPQWTYCAAEHGYCSFSGTAPVRYGENGVFTTLTMTNGTPCNNSVFGDPLYGTFKHCDVFQ